jgi:N-alpha-acetyltransferase 38, NatC auxiliary subunit
MSTAFTASGHSSAISPSSSAGAASNAYLTALLGSTLHLYTSDGRMFAGEFKCTDKDRNIILARTFEYRVPGPRAARAAATSSQSGESSVHAVKESAKVSVEATSRFVGLVVVPGKYITKIEVEEK